MVGRGCFTLLLRGGLDLQGSAGFACTCILFLTGQFGALTVLRGPYSRVAAAHTRMGADLLLGRKQRGALVSVFEVCGGQSHP